MALAKIRPITHWKPKPIEASFIKGIAGDASLTLQRDIEVSSENHTIQFQDGKITENIDFFKSPRCYLHLKEDNVISKTLVSGKVLKITKIDNIYHQGAVHVTFWFNSDSNISDLSCITNYNHTLTSSELKETLGNHFQISLTKNIEKEALSNTVPQRNAPTLSENTPAHYPLHSTRVILSDS
jgi:hypothetical protein